MPKRQFNSNLSARKVIVKNTFFNLIGQIIPIIAAILGVPILIRYLGIERFGILSILWLLMWYSTMLDLGLGRATTRFVSDAIAKSEFDKIPKIVWTSILVQIIIGLVLMFVFLALTPLVVDRFLKISPELISEVKTSLYIFSLSIPVILLSTSLQGLLEAYQRFDLINFVLAPVKVGILLLSIIGAILDLKLYGIMFLLIVMRVLVIVILFILDLKVCPGIRKFFNFEFSILPALFSFGGWITLINIVNPVLVYADRFLIGAILSTGILAYYTAPFEIIQRLWIIPASLMMTLFPAFSGLSGVEQKEKIVLIFSNAVKFTFVILFPLIFILSLFSFEFLKIWLGHEFAEKSSYVFKFLAFGILINSIAGFPAILLQGIGRPDITAKVYLGELIFYVPFVSLLIYKFGILGAGIGWLIRQIVDLILLYGVILKKKFISLIQLYNSNSLIALSILVVLSLIVFACDVWDLAMKITTAVFSLAVLSFLIWFKVFNKDEREMLKIALKNKLL